MVNVRCKTHEALSPYEKEWSDRMSRYARRVYGEQASCSISYWQDAKNEEATRAAISHRKRAARELNSGYYWLLLPSLGCWFLTANMVMLWHS